MLMMTSLTKLPYLSLPALRRVVLGLLGAAIGLSAPAQETRGGQPHEEDSLAYYAGPGVADMSSHSSTAPQIRHRADGATIMTLNWESIDGENVERRSADLILTSAPVPEPTYPFLGACAGCVVLLHRRRAKPSKLRPARVNLSGTAGIERLRSQCSTRAPETRATPASHRLLARRTPGRSSQRAVRAA